MISTQFLKTSKKSIVVFALILNFSSWAFAHSNNNHNEEDESYVTQILSSLSTNSLQESVTLQVQDLKEEVLKLRALEFDITSIDHEKKEIEVITTTVQKNYLKERSLGQNAQKKMKIISSSPIWLFTNIDAEYKDPEEIESYLKIVHANYPQITKLIIIGKTVKGKDIYALKITKNASEDHEQRPSVLFNSMHHAREIMTPEIAIDIIDQLTSQYESNPIIQSYVDSTNIYVVPMLNLDGNEKVWDGHITWRKNTRNGYGVDLNRNYPYRFGECGGSSGFKYSSTYRGKRAGSEPEVQSLMNLVKEVKPVFNISYHSYSEIVIYPYGCKNEHSQIASIVKPIGEAIAKKIDYKAGTAWELLYAVDGSDIDWMHDQHQVIPYVIEVNSKADGFRPSYSKKRDETVKRNRPGWMHLLNKVQTSLFFGKISDDSGSHQMNDLEIKVYSMTSSGANKDLVWNYKVNSNGTFFITLNKGSYKIEVSSKTHEKITQIIELNEKSVRQNFVLNTL